MNSSTKENENNDKGGIFNMFSKAQKNATDAVSNQVDNMTNYDKTFANDIKKMGEIEKQIGEKKNEENALNQQFDQIKQELAKGQNFSENAKQGGEIESKKEKLKQDIDKLIEEFDKIKKDLEDKKNQAQSITQQQIPSLSPSITKSSPNTPSIVSPSATPTTTQSVGGRKAKTLKGGKRKRKITKRKKMKKKPTSKKAKKVKKTKRKSLKKKLKGGGMFNGYVAYTPSFSVDVSKPLAPNNSALANPPPIKRMNNCLNTWKHLGSENKPYNKVWN